MEQARPRDEGGRVGTGRAAMCGAANPRSENPHSKRNPGFCISGDRVRGLLGLVNDSDYERGVDIPMKSPDNKKDGSRELRPSLLSGGRPSLKDKSLLGSQLRIHYLLFAC